MLVTTTQALWYIDLPSRTAWQIERGNGVYYGIACSRDSIFVAARRAEYGSDRKVQKGVIQCYNNELELVRTLEPPFPLRDLHQIDWFDNKLWVCATYDDLVAVWDGRRWKRWHPLSAGEESDERNLFHLNSIFAHDGEILVVGNKLQSGTIYRFDRQSRGEIGRIQLGKGAHNVWMEGDDHFTLSSVSGEVRSSNGWSRYLGNFPRGFAFDSSRRYVGISEVNSRTLRAQSHSSILALDRHWDLLEIVSLQGTGMIHDLRAPMLHDRAQAEDEPFRLVSGSWERFPSKELTAGRVFTRPWKQWLNSCKRKIFGHR